jgi:hypothetical protein
VRSGENVVVLATSAGAGRSRPQYIRDLLTCAGCPDRHRATFSYQSKWIQDGVLNDPDRLVGAPALVVFAFRGAGDEGAFLFHPLREARIVDFVPREIVERELMTRETYVALRFELLPLLPASPLGLPALIDRCTRWIRNQPQHPRPPMFNDPQSQSRFLLDLPPFDFEAEDVGDETAWIAHAEALAAADVLKGATIFRTQPLRTSRGKPAPFLPNREPGTYRLTSRRQYKLVVHTHSGALAAAQKAANAEELVRARVSEGEKMIRLSSPVTLGVGRESRATVFLHAEPASTREVATLIVEGESGKSPRIEYVVEVKPGYGALLFGVAAVSIGIALAAISIDDWKDAVHVGTLGAILLKALGGLLVAIGSYIGFRRVRPAGAAN